MRKMIRNAVILFSAATAATISSGADATTIVLTFDQANSCVPGNNLSAAPGPCGAGQNISPTYGSTAQLGVTYKNFDSSGALSQANLNWTSDESAYATGSNGPPEDLEFIFTPASGFEVSLSSIESWVNSGGTPVLGAYTLFNGSNQLVSTTPFGASPEAIGAPHTVTNFNNGYFSGPLRLHVTPESSRTISFDNVALDVRQISVSGAVPEPTAWAMMVVGIGFVGGVRRRRKSATRAVFA